MVKNRQKIEQIAGLVLIGAIIASCAFILKPFASTILWAAIMCFATWPLYEILLKWLHGRKTLAAATMTIILLLVLFVPFFIVGLTFTESIQSGIAWLKSQKQITLPPPPGWIEHVPLIGTKIKVGWSRLMIDSEPAINWLRPRFQEAGVWLLQHSIDVARGVFHLALSLLIAFFLYRDGLVIADQIKEGFWRISGDFAQRLIDVVKGTIRSVVYGMVGTALAQGIMAGIGFAIARVPSAMLLALFTFFLSFIPFGPALVWIGASIWLFEAGKVGWGIFMVIYGFFGISSVDNFIKPYIISRGSRLSYIVTFIGVFGGIATFGLIGVFLGPTLLAVGYSLIREIFITRKPTVANDTISTGP